MGQPMPPPPPGGSWPPPGPQPAGHPPPGGSWPPGPPPGPRPAKAGGLGTGCLVAGLAVAGLGAILVVLIVIAAVVVETEPDGPASPTAVTTAPDAGRSLSAPAPIGTGVSPAAGWTVTVVSAELDGNDTVAEGSSLNTPVEGNHFVLANITVRNDGSAPATFFDDVNLSLVARDGTTSEPCKETFPGKLDQSVELQPGEQNTGFACFELPVDDIPGVVLRTEPVLSRDQTGDRRFLALS